MEFNFSEALKGNMEMERLYIYSPNIILFGYPFDIQLNPEILRFTTFEALRYLT